MSGYDHLLNKLKSENVVVRRNAIKDIIDITYFDWVRDRNERDIYFAIPDLAVALKDEDAEVRSLALQGIAIELNSFDEHPVFQIMDLIIEVLFDQKRINIHVGAAHVLKDAVVKGFNISKEVNRLRELLLLEGENPVKLGVTDALTFHYAINKKWDKVKELLEHQDKEIRQETVGTLGRYELALKVNLEPIFSALKKHISDENDEVAIVAARSIIERSSEEEDLIPAIELALRFAKTHEDQKVRDNAISILYNALSYNIGCSSKLPKQKWSILLPIVQYFEEIFTSSKKNLKENLTKVLTKYYLHTDQFQAVEAFFKHKSPKVRSTSIFELYGCWHQCKVDIVSFFPLIVEIFLTDKNAEVRKAAETRLRDLSGRKHAYADVVQAELVRQGFDINQNWSFIEEIHKNQNITIIKKIEKEIKELENTDKMNKIKEYLDHEDPIIRAWTSYQIYIFAAYDKLRVRKLVPKLVKNLEDEDLFVRVNASVALAYIAEKVKIDEAIPFFAKLLHDKIHKIGHHAAYGLYQLVNQGKDISIAIPDLIGEIDTENKDAKYFIKEAIERFIIEKGSLEFLINLVEKNEYSKYKKDILEIIKNRKEKLLDLAKRYESMNHTQTQAINAYKTYLNIVPDDSAIWYQLAILYEKNNLIKPATEACNKSLELDKNLESAKDLLKKLQ